MTTEEYNQALADIELLFKDLRAVIAVPIGRKRDNLSARKDPRCVADLGLFVS